MKYSVKYKKVFDKNHKIVDISTITKENKEQEYYSIGTQTPMVAALGEKNQHYFRAKKGYSLNPETELHEYVKRMLKYRFDNEERFCISYYRKKCCSCGENCIFFDKNNDKCDALYEPLLTEFNLKDFYDTATIESGCDGFVADVLLSHSLNKKRKPVFLEVAVTHSCSKEKIASGHKIIEINATEEDDAFIELKQPKRRGYYVRYEKLWFHNFVEKETINSCPHFVKEKKYANQPFQIINTAIKTKFYCIPQQITNNPLKAYYDNSQLGMLFASNYYAKPFVFDKAISQDGKRFVMLGKDIYGAVKPWVVYSVSWNGKFFYHKAYGHFDYESALRDFTIFQGKEWTRGETLSDFC